VHQSNHDTFHETLKPSEYSKSSWAWLEVAQREFDALYLCSPYYCRHKSKLVSFCSLSKCSTSSSIKRSFSIEPGLSLFLNGRNQLRFCHSLSNLRSFTTLQRLYQWSTSCLGERESLNSFASCSHFRNIRYLISCSYRNEPQQAGVLSFPNLIH
jgi:hypothetical protein